MTSSSDAEEEAFEMEREDAKVLKKKPSDAEEEAFEMTCKFEMKHEDPRRKSQDCERMIGMECEKKRCKKQSSPKSRNKCDRVEMAANRKKMNKSCESVDEKRMGVIGHE